MSKLTQWLDHRMDVVGLNRGKDLSEYSGVPDQAIRDMNTCGSLDALSFSLVSTAFAMLKERSISFLTPTQQDCGSTPDKALP